MTVPRNATPKVDETIISEVTTHLHVAMTRSCDDATRVASTARHNCCSSAQKMSSDVVVNQTFSKLGAP